MDIRRYVVNAIGDTADSQGCSLSELIQHVDFYQRLIPTHSELLSAITTSIHDGEIVEVGHLRYLMAATGVTGVDFSGLSEYEFRRALNEFQDRASDALAKLERSGGA